SLALQVGKIICVLSASPSSLRDHDVLTRLGKQKVDEQRRRMEVWCAGRNRHRRRRLYRHKRLRENKIRRRFGAFHLHDLFRKSVDHNGKLPPPRQLRQQRRTAAEVELLLCKLAGKLQGFAAAIEINQRREPVVVRSIES